MTIEYCMENQESMREKQQIIQEEEGTGTKLNVIKQ